MQKQVRDLRVEKESYRLEVIEAKELKHQNIEYQQMILKFEEQSRIKEHEWKCMQDAIKQKVDMQD